MSSIVVPLSDVDRPSQRPSSSTQNVVFCLLKQTLTQTLTLTSLPQFYHNSLFAVYLIGVAFSGLKTTFKRFSGQKYIGQGRRYHFQGGVIGEKPQNLAFLGE